MTQEQLYLKKILETIEEIHNNNGLVCEPVEQYYIGFEQALDDLCYACNLGKEALHSHLIIWTSFVALNDNDNGYVDACIEVMQKVSELNFWDNWSFN